MIIVSTCTAAGWAMSVTGKRTILADRLQYYKNFATYAVGLESYASYRTQVDDHVTRNLRIVHRLKQLPKGRLLVSGEHALDLSPQPKTPSHRVAGPQAAGRSGETSHLRRAVTTGHAPNRGGYLPRRSTASGPAASALHRRYHRAGTIGNAVIYVR